MSNGGEKESEEEEITLETRKRKGKRRGRLGYSRKGRGGSSWKREEEKLKGFLSGKHQRKSASLVNPSFSSFPDYHTNSYSPLSSFAPSSSEKKGVWDHEFLEPVVSSESGPLPSSSTKDLPSPPNEVEFGVIRRAYSEEGKAVVIKIISPGTILLESTYLLHTSKNTPTPWSLSLNSFF